VVEATPAEAESPVAEVKAEVKEEAPVVEEAKEEVKSAE